MKTKAHLGPLPSSLLHQPDALLEVVRHGRGRAYLTHRLRNDRAVSTSTGPQRVLFGLTAIAILDLLDEKLRVLARAVGRMVNVQGAAAAA